MFEIAFLKATNSLIAADVRAAMLVERTIAKKSFGNLTLLLCKPCATFFYCFGTNMAVLSSECNHRMNWPQARSVLYAYTHLRT